MTISPSLSERTVSLIGSTPLVLDRMALDDEPATRQIKEITAKGGKMTEEDLARKDHLHFLSRLYFEEVNGARQVVVPWANIARSLRSGAAMLSTRMATQVNGVTSRGMVFLPLMYDGPRDPEELYADPRFRWRAMVNGNPTGKKAMVPTVRPIFSQWALQAPLLISNDIISGDSAENVFSITGQAIGIGNARKLGYGRFTVSFS